MMRRRPSVSSPAAPGCPKRAARALVLFALVLTGPLPGRARDLNPPPAAVAQGPHQAAVQSAGDATARPPQGLTPAPLLPLMPLRQHDAPDTGVPRLPAIPVWIDGQERGLVPARLVNGILQLRRDALLNLLDGLVRAAPLAALRHATGEADLTLADLANIGLEARFAAEQLLLELRVPLAVRNPRTLRLSRRSGGFGSADATDEAVLAPAPLSALLNWRIGHARWHTAGTTPRTFGRLALEGVVNLRGWVLEANGSLLAQAGPGFPRVATTVTTGTSLAGTAAPGTPAAQTDDRFAPANERQRGWRRETVRLVHDWPTVAVRAIAGDQLPRGSGLRGAVPIAGLGVERRFALNGSLAVRPMPSQALLLERGGTADVLVNDRLVSTLRLEPGIYQLRDIPVMAGGNDIEVRVREPGGSDRAVRFSHYYEPALLAPGIHEFDYAWGPPLTLDAAGRRGYRHDAPVLQAGHRLGLRPDLTAGLGLQADRHAWLLTGELLAALPAGNLFAEIGHVSGAIGPARAVRVQHRIETRPARGDALPDTLVVLWERLQDGFAVPGQITASQLAHGPPRVGARHELGLRYSREFDRDNSLVLAWLERRAAAWPTPQRHLAASWTRRLGQRASASLALTRSRGGLLPPDTSLTATLHWQAGAGTWFGHDQFTPGGGHVHEVNAEVALPGALLRAGIAAEQGTAVVTAAPATVIDPAVPAAPFASAPATGATRTSTLAQRALLRTQRIEASAQARQQRGHGGTPTQHDADLALAGALAWPGSDWPVVSAPIGDSYAIVRPHPQLAGYRITVDAPSHATPDADGAPGTAGLAGSDALGPPVVTALQSYVDRTLTLAIDGLPPGWDPGNDRPRLRPGYRSGTVVPIGTAGTTSVTGRLTGPDGMPLGLARGNWTDHADPGRVMPLFANRSGRFRIDGVAPGHYRLRFDGLTVDVVVPVAPAVAPASPATGPTPAGSPPTPPRVRVIDLGVLRLHPTPESPAP